MNSCMPEKSRKSRSTREHTRALDVQIQFMEGVVRRDPRYVEALQLLGDNYTKRGRYSEGLGVGRTARGTRTRESAGVL